MFNLHLLKFTKLNHYTKPIFIRVNILYWDNKIICLNILGVLNMSSYIDIGETQTSSIVTILVSGTVPFGQTLAVAFQLTVARNGETVPQYFSSAKQYTATDGDLIVSDIISMTIVPEVGTEDVVSFNGFSSLLVQLA